MIIVFMFENLEGAHCRLSAVCGPSTTAAGAITILRARLSIPNEVSIEMSLENGIPIRHVTAPLTSLRKQRGGVHTQVLQLRLYAELSGPATALREINFAAAEADGAEEEEEEEPVEGDANVADEAASDENASGAAAAAAAAAPPRVPSAKRQPSPAAATSGTVTPATARILKSRQISPGRGGNTTSAAPSREGSTGQKRLPSPRPARTVMAMSSTRGPSRKSTTPAADGSQTAGAATAPLALHRTPAALISPRGPRQAPATARPANAAHSPRARAIVNKKNPNAASLGPTTTTTESPDSIVKTVTEDRSSTDDDADDTAVVDLAQRVQAQQQAGKVPRGFARRDIAMAHIIMREYPKLCDTDPAAIVTAVHGDPSLMRLGYDKTFQESSTMDGLSDEDYSHCLSIGAIHGLETRVSAATGATSASAAIGQKVALYGQLGALRHSCRPNATVHYELFSAPYAASCRCARAEGLKKGDEITFLYRRADSQAFLLLSKDRRQNLLRRTYQFECTCERCKMTTNKVSDVEAKLTGAFFTDSAADTNPNKQRELSEEMRVEFDLLQLMDDSGVEITLSLPGNVPPLARTKQCNRLLGFIRKYSSTDSTLRLHDHHWRLNLCRAAYIQETVRLCAMKGATPEARRKAPTSRTLFTPNKTVYDLCLKQLAVESDFIPAGHPHQLTTYESFQFLMSILPSTLAQSISRTAENASNIDWDQLQRTKEAWNVLKRSSVPPTMRRQLVEKSHN